MMSDYPLLDQHVEAHSGGSDAGASTCNSWPERPIRVCNLIRRNTLA
jgi:hypothetical protein